jgi:hypothetical protein
VGTRVGACAALAVTAALLAGCGEDDFKNEARAPIREALEGESMVERQGPIGPGDTATIQKTLEPGDYEVKAGSARAVTKEIKPATLRIGKERANSNNELLLP